MLVGCTNKNIMKMSNAPWKKFMLHQMLRLNAEHSQ